MIDKSVEEKILIVEINEKNINMSLTLDHTNVFNAAFIVYILDE
jgi:hypothetical protein